MTRILMTSYLTMLTLIGFSGNAMAGAQVSGAVVELLPTTDAVRLSLDAVPADFNPRIICDGRMIRVRLSGIASGSNDEIESIPVPGNSVFSRVRLVPRDSGNTVLQLSVNGNPRKVCDSMRAFVIENQVVISADVTPELIERRRKIEEIKKGSAEKPKDADSLLSRLLRKEDAAAQAKEPQRDDDTPAAVAGAQAADGESDSARPVVTRKTDKLAGKDNPTASPGGAVTSPSMAQISIAVVFIALIGGVAWYAKRHRGIGSGAQNQIDILSAKRIGAKHQLVIASVEGNRFLLGITEQSVTTLGMLDGNQVKTPLQKPAAEFGIADIAPETGQSTLNALRNAVDEASLSSSRNTHTRFQTELEKSMSAGIRGTIPRPRQESDTKIASNVGGLMALARMRAQLDSAASRNPEMEA